MSIYSDQADDIIARAQWLAAEAERLAATPDQSEQLRARLDECEQQVLRLRSQIARKDVRIATLRERLAACQNPSVPAPTMLVGSSLYREQGETSLDAFNRRAANWGVAPEAVRYFDPDWKLDGWPVFGDARVYTSFKGDPQVILSGQYDAHYRDLFGRAPADRDVYWTYWHEPEDNTEDGAFTADQYRRAFDHIAAIEDTAAGSDRIFRGPILMNWSLQPGARRDYRNWVPSAQVDFLGWDCYPGLDEADIRAKYQASVDATKAVGIDQWALMETAPQRAIQPTPDQLTAWVSTAARVARELGFMSWCYYDAIHDGNDFRLTTEAQWAAMAAEISK